MERVDVLNRGAGVIFGLLLVALAVVAPLRESVSLVVLLFGILLLLAALLGDVQFIIRSGGKPRMIARVRPKKGKAKRKPKAAKVKE